MKDYEKCNEQGCNLKKLEEDSKCILHSKKKDKDIELFWKKIRENIPSNDIKKTSLSRYKILENVYFPKFEEPRGLSALLTNTQDKGLNFLENGEKNELDFTLQLKNCTFFEEANFKNIKFNKGITLRECILKKGLNLENAIFQKNSKTRVEGCKINNINLHNTTFNDLANFYDSTFEGKINFEKTTFNDISVFTKVAFKDDVNFKYTTFSELAQFKEAIFEKKLDLEDSIIKNEINFLGIKNKDGNNLKAENIANRETARVIKNSFEKQNNIIEANKFYALEMAKREEELSFKKDPFEWLVFKIHKITSNHSQSWFLVLLWIINLTYIYHLTKINTYHYKEGLLGFAIVLSLVVSLYTLILKINPKIGKIGLSILSLLCIFFSSININEFANILNPFSMMAKGEDLTFSMLLYKSAMAYLIYQFIISIRQNTRRK